MPSVFVRCRFHDMDKKLKYTPAYRTIAVILSILFLWCFGTSLLIVILNIGIGFADNTAGFRKAFLNMTAAKEMNNLHDYLELSERAKKYPNIVGLQQNLQAYQTQYDPNNTNFRFSATDSDGMLLLTNDPNYGSEQPLLASDTTNTSIFLEKLNYQISQHFDDPVNDFAEIVYGRVDISQFLDQPSDYLLWYFTDDKVAIAYRDGLDVLTLDGQYTDYMFFKNEEEARKYDYEGTYGEECTWEITTSAAHSYDDDDDIIAAGGDAATASEKVQEAVTGSDGAETGTDAAVKTGSENEQADPHIPNDDGHSVVVTVTAYGIREKLHMSLEKYYEMKRNNLMVYAESDELEDLLMSGLDITIRAESSNERDCYIRTYLPEKLTVQDSIRSNYEIFYLLFKRSEWSVIIMFVSLALTIIACISMCTAAGHSRNDEEITVARIHQFAYEIFFILPPIVMVATVFLLRLLSQIDTPYRMIAIFCVGMILCIAASAVLWLYTTAVRVKAGIFGSSFGIVRAARRFFGLFRNKTLTCFFCLIYALGLFILNAVVVPQFDDFLLSVPIIALDFLTLLLMVYIVYAYFELHRHVQRMETGDFKPVEHPVPLAADFGRFDRSLNEITGRVGEIVAKQTKAEHLRTELITNVSHDLKTPLTSIVNYVDLLSREKMPNETAEEYLDVLRRQAARLKKLTIDLVDASKASTGNLNVELMPMDIHVLLEQIAGEYEEQMEKNALSIVLNVPDEPLMILADSRQIWRVFDNLLSNACKYALSGTRVYLDVRTNQELVEITMKNISASPLNISPDLLMERFIRGDKSRHTEGSGLGLSIARDLTALQNGMLDLHTDGDLFKAILTFPIYHAPILPDADGTEQEMFPPESDRT